MHIYIYIYKYDIIKKNLPYGYVLSKDLFSSDRKNMIRVTRSIFSVNRVL